MFTKKIKFSLILSLCLVFFLSSIVYANSPKDSNGIYICSSYTYNGSLKTFNCEADGPKTVANLTFGNTVGLVTNEIVPSYLHIKNDTSSQDHAFHFSIGYDNDYVIIDDIYYRSDSDTMDTIYQNNAYRTDGTIDTTIVFGNPAFGEGWIGPGERVRVYIDWQYKGGSLDWYLWAPEFEFLEKDYHFISGPSNGGGDLWSGIVPEVGTSDDIQLLGDDLSFFSSLQSDHNMNQLEEEDVFAEWREIQLQKKNGLRKATSYEVTITNAKGEVVLVTDSLYYKDNKSKIEEEFNLVPSN